MTNFIPDELIDTILDKTDIVEIISSRIPIKKTGRNFKANCPFHSEKTPSFIVSPEKQIYHCFGCGSGGNALGFLIKHDRLTFGEAIKILADKAGVKLPMSRISEKEEEGIGGKLYKANETAKDFYKNNLITHKADFAYKYLTERGLDDDTIKKFEIGLAPNAWHDLFSFCKNKGIGPEVVEKAGLVLPSEKDKGFYDRFRNRIIFPIFDIRDKVIGFGARALGDIQPKYINSPETPIYSKGKNLYGMNFNKNFIREKDYCIIVEGYLDLIIPFQYGIKNIVATLGTALTPEQIRLIKRFTRTVVMVFDPDKAGEEASLRGLDLLISSDMNVRVATLPKGYDPDSFTSKYGKEAFEKIIKGSKDLFDYKINLLMTRYNKDGVRGRSAIANLMLPTIQRIPNEILKAAFLKKLSETLSVDEVALRAELKKLKPEYVHAVYDEVQRIDKWPARHAELHLLSMVLDSPETLLIIEEKLSSDEFRDESIKKIIDLIKDFVNDNKKITPSKIINHLEDERATSIVSEAVSMQETIKNKEKVLLDCINRVKEDNFKEDLNKLQDDIRLAQLSKNHDKVNILLSKYNELIKTHKK